MKKIFNIFKNKKPKTFVILNNSYIGDTILTNSLVQNIKRIYEDSKVIMVVAPNLENVAKILKDVDEVIIWDRKGIHKNFWGTLKFIKDFPYKFPYATFPIHSADRAIVMAWLMCSKYILCYKTRFFSHFTKKIFNVKRTCETMQGYLMDLLSCITKEDLKDVPIVLQAEKSDNKNKDLYKDSVALIPTSTSTVRDIPVELFSQIVEKLNDKQIVMLGHGESIKQYSTFLKEKKYKNVVDLSNQTTLEDAITILNNIKGVISVDTGLMHMSCALNKPVVNLFFVNKNQKGGYIPDEDLYNCKNITENHSADNIIEELKILIQK